MKINKLAIFSCLFGLAIFNARAQAVSVHKNAGDTIPLKVDSLKAAVVTASMRPRMKGDTLEFNTARILMRPNSVVEDLLRRLPGLRIDPDGTITYNGEKIQHLLVDGEDVFGSDPTMVTRNFDASRIARVQILDRKSDQAVFTGIDDGTRTKTLNLVMKESEKNGYFGKLEAGGNAGKYYYVDGALAAFKDKEQFTALGIAANTGVTGYSNSTGSGSVSFMNGNVDVLGTSAGNGIPQFSGTALHYANTWNSPGDHLTANYQFSQLSTHPVTTTQLYQTQPDSVYAQHLENQSINRQDQHWFYGIYDWAPNDRSAFNMDFHYSNTHGQNQFESTGNGTYNDTLVNSNQRTIRDNVSRQNIGGDLNWRIRIGKQPHRVFSFNTSITKVDLTTDGYLYGLNHFYLPNGSLESTDTVDQRKQITSHSLSLGATFNYTQPVWKGAELGLSYGVFTITDDPLQATFDRGDGKYQNIVDSLSTYFRTQTINQHATLDLQGKTASLTYTIGSDWLGYGYSQKDLLKDSILHLHYSNLAPRILLNYTTSPTLNFNFKYNASTQNPTIAQLAPVKNNADPLHITLGNPGLKPGFMQNFALGFRSFKTWLISVNTTMNLTSNTISTKTTTDSLGRQVSQPVNVDGEHGAGLNFSISRKISGVDLGVHTVNTYTRSVNYMNTVLSRNDAYTAGGGISLSQYVADKYSFQLTTDFTHFDQVSSINTSAPTHYWTQNHQGTITFYFVRNFEFGTYANYTWQEKTSTFSANTSVLLWNGYISRNFFRDKLVAKFLFNNILNSNTGISRTNVNNINTQSSTNILGRYWMLSAIYHFDKKFKKK